MTDVLEAPVVAPVHHTESDDHHGPTGFLKWITSTDHKVIGMSYTVTSVIMMVIGGIFAEIIRAQLSTPNGTQYQLRKRTSIPFSPARASANTCGSCPR